MKTITFLSVFVPLIFSGCIAVSNPSRPAAAPGISDPCASSAVARARISAFQQATAKAPIRGTWLYPSAFKPFYSAAQTMDMVSEFGFNQVNFCITSETELDDFLRDLIFESDKRNINCGIILNMSDFYSRKAGNRLLSAIRPASPTLPEMTAMLIDKIQNDDVFATLDTVTVVANPHLFTAKNLDTPKNIHFVWSENNFGIGLDNDMLMKMTLKMLRDLPEFPPQTKLVIAVPDFYNELAEANMISCGRISDFAAVRDPRPQLVLITSGNKASELIKNTADELQDNSLAPQSVILLTQIAPHTSVASGKIRRRDWNDYVRITDYLQKKAAENKTFGGIISGPFGIMKTIQMEP